MVREGLEEAAERLAVWAPLCLRALARRFHKGDAVMFNGDVGEIRRAFIEARERRRLRARRLRNAALFVFAVVVSVLLYLAFGGQL